MTARYREITIAEAVAGEGRDTVVVFMVSGRRFDGSDDYNVGSSHEDENAAEDAAAVLANRLGVPLIDERGLPPPAPRPDLP